VLGFELLDAAGRVVASGSTGDPLTFRIRYRAHEAIDEPVFGLGFSTEKGVRVAGPNTRFGRVETGRVEGDGSVDFSVDALTLMPGAWLLSIAVVDSSMLHTYDQLDEAFEFQVQSGSSAERYGITDLRGHWSISN
jgi:lipopolysaccharide transport system ATP-binding protein